MSEISRRTLLRGAVAGAGAAALGGPFAGFLASPAGATVKSAAPGLPLRDDIADLRDNRVRLHVPEGFQYRSFHDTEFTTVLDDGTVLPGRHDGMAAFKGKRGNVILVRNHEVNNPTPAFGDASQAYDPMAGGGTTTIEVTKFGEVVRAFTSLNGTQMNCAGGPMPWGSWITCEETVNGPDVGRDFTNVSNVPLTQRHGFIFEVPANGQSNREPITRAGRFAHEAAAFDTREGILYLTEDNFGFPSGFYRYIPKRNPMHTGRLDNQGRLQMLAVKGQPNADLAKAQPKGAKYRVEWVDIDDPDPSFPYTPGQEAPTTNNDAINYVANQGRAKGAAGFSRLEGAACATDVVYFTATQGGGAAEPTEPLPTTSGWGNGSGQVWAYWTKAKVLELIYESPGPDALDLPDNCVVSKRGALILCEDNINDNFVRGLTWDGKLFNIALNRVVSSSGASRFNDEFAGATFSPDGHTLFVNIQASRGMSFAIWGPWGRLGV